MNVVQLRGKIVVLVSLIGIGVAAYWALKPRLPFEFLSQPPDISFYSAKSIDRHPIISWSSAPFGSVIWPKRLSLGRGETAPEMLVGYMDWSRESDVSPVYWVVDKMRIPATFGDLDNQKCLEIPYATDARYQDVELVRGINRHRIRLPVQKRFGGPDRDPTILKAGENSIVIKPLPWTLTIAPLYVSLTTDAQKGKAFIAESALVGRSFKVATRGWLVEAGKETFCVIRPSEQTRAFTGTLHEVKVRPMQISLGDVSDAPTIVDSAGKPLCALGYYFLEERGILGLTFGGFWHANRLVKMARAEHGLYDYKHVNDLIEAEAYWTIRKWPFKYQVTPALPFPMANPGIFESEISFPQISHSAGQYAFSPFESGKWSLNFIDPPK